MLITISLKSDFLLCTIIAMSKDAMRMASFEVKNCIKYQWITQQFIWFNIGRNYQTATKSNKSKLWSNHLCFMNFKDRNLLKMFKSWIVNS